ncbi:MAG: substrate-binding and VWA domain-containing protein [Phycicoccus sp.]
MSRTLALVLVPVLALSLAAGGVVWWRAAGPAAADTDAGCAEPLTVLVAAELATTARGTLGSVRRSGCRVAEVESASSAVAVQQIAAGRVPDVWVPDSSAWLDALTGSGRLPTAPGGWAPEGSVATSPVVLVSPTGGASEVTEAPASWDAVVNGSGAVRMADPDNDIASRLAYYSSRLSTDDIDIATAGRLVFASRFAATNSAQLFDAAGAAPADIVPFPASEQAAAAFAETRPRTIRAWLPAAGTMSLDYPWLMRTGLDADLTERAGIALRAMRSDDARARLADAGFRVGAGSGPAQGGVATPGYTDLPLPGPQARAAALEQWDVLRTDSRMLAVLDVSGSMKYPAPGTRGLTRAKVLEESSITALRTLPAGSAVGTWIFSTDRGGRGVDHAELLPVRRLDTQVQGRTWRQELERQVRTIPRRLGGDTGLYDTAFAAYTRMVAEYDDSYVNSVVILTDGENDDPGGGLTLAQLLQRIEATKRADRPVRIVTIGMGEADPSDLQAISKATGGTSYIANTPADIQNVFVRALLARSSG